MTEEEKITIIEGPPPTFELVSEPIMMGMTEGPEATQVAMCRLRTFNGPTLVERCYRAWQQQQTIRLEFRSEDGMTQEAPIIAARWAEVDQGHILLLWVRLAADEIEVEFDFDSDEFDDDFDDDWEDDDFDLRT